MTDVEGALRRARIRIRYHGWRRSTDAKSVPGWTLKEAIIGHKPTVIPEHELQAILAVAEACGVRAEELDAWNDAPYREAKEVLKAISRARKSIKAPPPKMPDRCAQRRMASEVMGLLHAGDYEVVPEDIDDIKAEAAEGEGPLEDQMDLEEVIKDHLRGR